jgi:GTP cyclohydrolase II
MTIAVERCIDELRRGRAIVVDTGTDRLAVLPLDLASQESLARFAQNFGAAPHLLITGQRAGVLKLTNARVAAGAPTVALVPAPAATIGDLIAIADPVEDLAAPFKGPFKLSDVGSAAARSAAMALVKLARLLPAALIAAMADAPEDWLQVSADAVQAYPDLAAQNLKIVARARVPLLDADETEVVAFRSNDGALEHLALIIGDPPRRSPVLTRLHSECFTGDLLGSLKCDCGPQLRGAIDRIAEAGNGVLLYLAQEGRGIGLVNKLRAYALQDQGFDTVDANTRLGFEVDERNFAPAARMLTLLGFSSVQLMTNNPDKVAMLERCGIRVAARVAHAFPSNQHNARYLATKRDRSGHLLT